MKGRVGESSFIEKKSHLCCGCGSDPTDGGTEGDTGGQGG